MKGLYEVRDALHADTVQQKNDLQQGTPSSYLEKQTCHSHGAVSQNIFLFFLPLQKPHMPPLCYIPL